MSNDRPLYSHVRKRRCAQCWGPVADRQLNDGSWEIYCPKGCQPGGHVSQEHVEIMRANDSINYAKAAENYPELDPFRVTSEERNGSLFQEG